MHEPNCYDDTKIQQLTIAEGIVSYKLWFGKQKHKDNFLLILLLILLSQVHNLIYNQIIIQNTTNLKE